MFKKSLLIMLLMAMFAPWAANAQTLTVYDDESATNRFVPIDGYNVDASGLTDKSEYIMPATQLTAMNGKEITKMKLYLSTVGNRSWGNATFRVFMKEVEETTINSFTGYSDATTVYSGSLDCTTSEMEIVFTNNYTYNGGNLLIGFYILTKGSYTGSYGDYKPYYSGKTVEGASYATTSTTNSSQQNFLPKTTFTYQTPACCPAPTGLDVFLTEGNGNIATFSWQKSEPATNWVLQYGTNSSFEGNTTEITGSSNFTINGNTVTFNAVSGLTAEELHYARVKAYCESCDDYSDWSNVIAFTPTNAHTLTINDPTTTTNAFIPFYYYVGGYSTMKSQFIIPSSSIESTMQWGEILKLTFYNTTSSVNYGNGKFNVYLGIVEDGTTLSSQFVDWTLLTLVVTSSSVSISDNKMEIEFTTPYYYTGGNLLIGFSQTASGTSGSYGDNWVGVTGTAGSSRYYTNSQNSSSFLPKITFSYIEGQAPSCLPVSGLSCDATGITSNSVVLNWNTGASNEENWKLQYKKTTDAGFTTYPSPITEKPFTLGGLAQNSTYEWQVAAWCDPTDDDDISMYVAGTNFTTACSAPWTENFEDFTANTVPAGWDNTASTSTTLSSTPYYIWGVYNNNENNMIRMNNSGVKSGTALINSPQISIPSISEGEFELSFNYSHRANCGDLTVKISEDGGTTFSNLESYSRNTAISLNNTDPGQFSEATISLADYAGKSIILQFYASSNYSSGAIFVDNVQIAAAPSCRKPSGLTCTTKTQHSATFSWTNGADGQDAWQISYSTNPDFDPADGTIEDVDSNPATLTGLTHNTQYYAYVRANCGNNEYSSWNSLKVAFKTDQGNLAPTAFTVTDRQAHQASFEWTNGGGEYETSWQIYLNSENSIPADDNDLVADQLHDVNTNPADISGLTEETTYYAWVRANCGNDGMSAWTALTGNSFTTTSECQTPDGLNASDITNNSAVITWNTYGLTTFNLRYSSDGTTWTDKPNVTSPYTITGLNGNTDYQVQVQATCNTTIWSDVLNLSTECDPVTITENEYISENFDDYELGSNYNYDAANGIIPDCWDNGGNSDKMPHIIGEGCYSNYYWKNSGAQAMFFYGTAYSNSYLYLPEISNDLTTLQISFWMRTENSDNGKLSLGYFNAQNNFVVIEEYAKNPNNMVQRITYLGLKENTPEHARLVFRWAQPNTSWYACSIDDVVVQLAPSCFEVGTLSYESSSITTNSVVLNWTLVDAGQDAWQVQYATNESFNEGVQTVSANTNTNFTLSGLTPAQHYYVRVRGNCGDNNYGAWSNVIDFLTEETCPAPTNLAASNPTQYTVDLVWNGESDSYNIQYRTKAGLDALFFEGFEYVNNLAGWAGNTDKFEISSSAKHTGSKGMVKHYITTSYNQPEYIISPDVSAFTSGSDLKLEFYYSNNSNNYTEEFYVGFSSTNTEVGSFTFGETLYSVNDMTWKRFYEDIPTGTKYFAIKHTSIDQYDLYLDDFTIGVAAENGEWQDATSTTTSKTLTGLTAGKNYEVKVQGVCDNVPGSYCEAVEFTTTPYRTLITSGAWNTATNWNPAGVPGSGEDVAIAAEATIPANYLAQANNINIVTGGSITIADGGQLITNSAVQATVQKEIGAFASNGWKIIASPISGSIDFPAGLTTNGEIYKYDELTHYWRYYAGSTPFTTMANQTGYLYGNDATVTLAFTGTLVPCGSEVTKSDLSYTSDNEGIGLDGWNLVGNPFACNAYTNKAYYVAEYDANAGENVKTKFTAKTISDAIAPCTGILVKATSEEDKTVKFKTSQYTDEAINSGNILLAVAQQVVSRGISNSVIRDNAIVSFNEDNELAKFVFNDDNAKLYIPQDGKDYAIVASEGQGTLPVNFKATENGTYTLAVNPEGVEMNYLHLIDNMTGADIDLLQTPSYSFNATTNDYESRFRLVFVAANNEDGGSTGSTAFAFMSDGNWIISNEGEATLQVIDITGRILSSETVNGSVSKAIQAAPGVYVLRLINGENVKVQKVVIE